MRTSAHSMTFVAASLLIGVSLVQAARPAEPQTLQETTPAQRPDPRLIAALRGKIPVDPITVDRDPYRAWHGKVPPPAPAGTVCGVRFESDQVHYRLVTFTTTTATRAAGFAVTHFGACGTCSTLQDLAVYLEKPDLTTPVRRCGIRPESSALMCLGNLGFSAACARTWLYNVQNTRRQCLTVCAWSWIKGETSTGSDGRLNSCLQCDEDRSGPVFKATAGRTRRNSGIHSSIPRPNEQIAPVVHDYLPELAPR